MPSVFVVLRLMTPSRAAPAPPGLSFRRAAQRGWMARQLQLLASIDDLRPVYLQDRYIAVEEVSDIGIGAVRREGHAFGKSAELDLAHFAHLLAVDLQCN